MVETRQLLASRSRAERRALMRTKLADLDERIARAQHARALLEHALGCPSPSFQTCRTFRALVAERLDQLPDRTAGRSAGGSKR